MTQPSARRRHAKFRWGAIITGSYALVVQGAGTCTFSNGAKYQVHIGS